MAIKFRGIQVNDKFAYIYTKARKVHFYLYYTVLNYFK